MNHSMKTLGAVALAGLALTSSALAQGQGGRGGRPTTGAVTAVDTAAMTITVAGANGAPNQTIKLATDTPIAVEAAGTVADVKVGDTVNVADAAGVVTITDGTLPDAFGFYGRILTGAGGGGRGFGGGGANGGGNNTATANAPAFSITNGKVTAISPLTISAGTAVSITMSSTTGVKVNRITTGQLSAVKVGDQVLALGQPGADGVVAATAVALNFPQAQGGFGGGRNRQGGGGFGGNNAGGGGQGGFGQGQNGQNGAQAQGGGQGQGGRRRRNRNGQGGAPGQGGAQGQPGGGFNQGGNGQGQMGGDQGGTVTAPVQPGDEN